jgi:hypothetical protein
VAAWQFIGQNAELSECRLCPKYRKYHGGEDLVLTEQAFCGVCMQNHREELRVYCTTNRRLQRGSGEPFECYKFSPDIKKKK